MARKAIIEKKPYGTPRITRVDLRSEEAVLTACKTEVNQNVVAGESGGQCNYHGTPCTDFGT